MDGFASLTVCLPCSLRPSVMEPRFNQDGLEKCCVHAESLKSVKLPDEELLWEQFRTNRNLPPTHSAQVFWYIVRHGYATQQDLCWEFGMSLQELRVITEKFKRNGMLYTTTINRPFSTKWRAVYGVPMDYFYFCKDCTKVWAVEPTGNWKHCPSCGGTNILYDEGES